MATANELIDVLPPYKARETLIVKSQDVGDIMQEVVAAHKYFSSHYDTIPDFFWMGNVYDTCLLLWRFCKANVSYRVEPEKSQTTKSPAAILVEAHGDCKHYAGFIAGVLDAINRAYGTDMHWEYCFANYDKYNDTPQHVFVVVKDREGKNGEIWVDPVLNAFDERVTPVSTQRKKVRMPLSRVSGINDFAEDAAFYDEAYGGVNNALYSIDYQPNTLGWTWQTSTGWTQGNDLPKVKWGDEFYGSDYLGLTRYGNIPGPSPENDRKFIALRDELQQYIDEFSPQPYPLSTNLLAKVIGENIQNWNFLYPKGTSPKPRNWKPFLQDYVLWTITDDGRLTFDRDVEPPHNYPQIHKLIDWLNFLVQTYSDETYIPTIEHVKRLGSGWKTPEGGSAWHVIHTGDKNLAKFTNFASSIVNKIPGLSSFLQAHGLSVDSLTNFANAAGWGSGGGIAVPDGVIEGEPDQASKKNLLPIALAAGVGIYLLTRKKKKAVSGILNNKTVLIGGGLIALLLIMKNKKTPGSEGDAALPGEGILPPSTATPPILQDKQILVDTGQMNEAGFVASSVPGGGMTKEKAYTSKPGYSKPSLIDALEQSFYNQYT